MKRFTVVLLFALTTAVLFAACGGGGGNGGGAGNVQLSGTIGTGYQVAAAPKGFFARVAEWFGFGSDAYAVAGDPAVDTVVALQIYRGSLNSSSMISGKEAPIQANGSFSLVLEKNYDWLLVLMNSQATGTGRFVGSVAVNVASGGGESLLGLPLRSAEVEAIDLGAVTRSTSTTEPSDALATQEVSTVDFSMTLDQMLALSKTDDVFRNAKNIVSNYDTVAGTWYGILAAFTWTNTSPVNPGFTSPMSSAFSGYGLQLDTNSTSVTIQNVCGVGAQKMSVGLFPPSDVLSSGPASTTYGPSHGMTNDNVTACYTEGGNTNAGDSDFFAGSNPSYTDKTISYGFSGVQFPLPLPAGDWTWRENGQIKAAFDLTVSAPSTSTGRQKGFVPSIKASYGADNLITSVDVKWSYLDESTGFYIDIAPGDIGVLKHALPVVEIALYEFGHDTDTAEKIMFDPITKSTIIPAGAWYYGTTPPLNAKRLSHINMFYETGGIGRVIIFSNFP